MTRVNAVLAAATVVLGSGCFVLFRDLGIERERVQALEARLAEVQREFDAPEPAVQSTGAPTTTTPESTRGAAPAASATPAPIQPTTTQRAASKNAAAKHTAELDQWRRLMADPAYRAAMVAQHRLRLEPQYADLSAEVGLSEGEADRFLDLLAEQGLRESEQLMMDGQNDPNMEKRRQRRKEFAEQVEAERKALLGEDRFRTWTEYVNSAGARAQMQALRTQLASSSSPLRDDQVQPLVKALAAEHQRHAAERQQHHASAQWTAETPAAEQMTYMKRRAALIEESLERSHEIAAMYLDSEQQRRFDAMLDLQRERARADLELWRASLKAESRGQVAAGSR